MAAITTIRAVRSGDLVTVSGEIDGIEISATFWQATLDAMDEDARKAHIRERLLAQLPTIHDTHDLGFDEL